MKTKIVRRDFIRKMSLGSLVFFIPNASHLTKLYKSSATKLIAIDPFSALVATKTTLDLVSSFSGSKDNNPMTAMLQYENQMLDIISEQLKNIQEALVAVENAILHLPEQFQESLKLQYQNELIAQVRGAAQRYNDIILIPSMADPSILENESVKDELKNIIYVANQDLSTLMNLPGGLSPEACMIAPLALSLEVSGRSALNQPPAIIKSTLLKYRKWFNDMISDKTGSIPNVLSNTVALHDQILAEIENNHLAKMYKLENYKIGGSQKSEQCNDPLIMFSKVRMSPLDFPHRSATRINENMRGFIHGIYWRSSRLQVVLREDVGTYLIELSDPLVMIADNPKDVHWLFPNNGEYGYIYYGAPIKSSKNELEKIANSKGKHWSDHIANRQLIKTAISNANVQRVKLSFCSYGFTIANNSIQRINEFLKLI